MVDRPFAAVVSCHSIEHQPDLVRHLNQVRDILQPGGQYFLIIPDKRFCFDQPIPESTIADIIDAHIGKRSVHSIRSIVEHVALTTHNDPVRHWAGDHGTVAVLDRVIAITPSLEGYKDAYLDVHAWQFTPDSLKVNIDLLNKAGFIDLEVERVYNTPRPRLEFCAVLRKPS